MAVSITEETHLTLIRLMIEVASETSTESEVEVEAEVVDSK